MRRALTGAVIAAIVLTGCANTSTAGTATDSPDAADSSVSTPTQTETDDDTDGPSESASESPGEDAFDDDAIEIEIEGDKITPNGELIKVQAGETVRLDLRSDRAGALHVHSTPEQELDFGKGGTTLAVTIDTPGIVDVEEHESGVVVLQLEVS